MVSTRTGMLELERNETISLLTLNLCRELRASRIRSEGSSRNVEPRNANLHSDILVHLSGPYPSSVRNSYGRVYGPIGNQSM